MPTTETAAFQSQPMISLSDRDAVKKLAGSLLGLIFDGGGFEEMIASSGLGMLAMATKPVVKKRALASIESIGPEQAAWIIDQIHRLSYQFENETGNYSPYHYEKDETEHSGVC